MSNVYAVHTILNQLPQLKNLSAESFSNTITKVFKEAIEAGQTKEIFINFDKIVSQIPLDKLKEALEIKDALKAAQNQLEIAKIYLGESTETSLKYYYRLVVEAVLSLTETLYAIFSFGNLFRPAENRDEAEEKSYKLIRLSGNFSMWSYQLVPAFGAALATKILGVMFIAASTFNWAWPKIKPMPKYLPIYYDNWTKRAQAGQFRHAVPLARLEAIDKAFASGLHPLLVGPSHIGKSLTAKAYAKYVEEKGIQVFKVNMADLIKRQSNCRSDGGVLKEIQEVMGRHYKEIVLVFDKIDIACGEDPSMANQLKPYLDEGGGFDKVIGITTKEEYEKHIQNNQAFLNRFQVIEISNTDENETLRVLGTTAVEMPSKPILEENVLHEIYNQCEQNVPQPYTAALLLKTCVTRTKVPQKSQTETEIQKIFSKIFSKQAQAAAYGGVIDVADLENQLARLQTKLKEEQAKLDLLNTAQEDYHRTRKLAYEAVFKIDKAAHEAQIKQFLVADRILTPLLHDYIKSKSAELGITRIVDRPLVREVADYFRKKLG